MWESRATFITAGGWSSRLWEDACLRPSTADPRRASHRVVLETGYIMLVLGGWRHEANAQSKPNSFQDLANGCEFK